MSTVNDTNKIDLIGIDKECNHINLEILDSIDWDDEEKHLLLLEQKINTYLSFIESGQIYEVKPEGKGKKIVITVIFAYELTENAIKFLFTVAHILHDAGYKFEYQIEKPHKLRCTPLLD